jgi:hypothetical protein
VLKPEGKTAFDDLAEVKAIVPHKIDQLKFGELAFSSEYYNHTKVIPKPRASG